MRQLGQVITISIFSILLSGCATPFWTTYPKQVSPVKQQVVASQLKKAQSTLKDIDSSQNFELYYAELGRIQQLSGLYKQSISSYQKAIDHVRQRQLKAKVRLSQVALQSASLLGNDTILPYDLKGYEIVLMYQYQALNYLALGDMSNALVSIRRAIHEQKWIKDQHYQELVNLQKKSKNYQFKMKDHPDQFHNLIALGAHVKSAFENAGMAYLSSILFDSQQDLNDAWISIQQAYRLAPNNPAIWQQYLKVVQQKGDPALLASAQKKFKLTPPAQQNSATLVVFMDQGWVPPMNSINIPVPIAGHGQVQILSLPTYNVPFVTPQPVSVVENQHVLGKTTPTDSIQTLAAKQLSEDMPFIAAKAIARVAAKAVTTGEIGHKEGQNAEVIAQIFSLLSSQADLRSWLTLPNNTQTFQIQLKPGKKTITLQGNGLMQNIPVQLTAHQTTLIWASQLGTRLQYKITQI